MNVTLISWRCNHSTIGCCNEIYAHLTQSHVLPCQHYCLSNRTITVQDKEVTPRSFVGNKIQHAACVRSATKGNYFTKKCNICTSRITVNIRDMNHEKRNPPRAARSTILQFSEVSSNQHLRDVRKPQADPWITITKFWPNKLQTTLRLELKCLEIRQF